MSQKDGTTEEHGDMVDRSRLMMDARKWLRSVRSITARGQLCSEGCWYKDDRT